MFIIQREGGAVKQTDLKDICQHEKALQTLQWAACCAVVCTEQPHIDHILRQSPSTAFEVQTTVTPSNMDTVEEHLGTGKGWSYSAADLQTGQPMSLFCDSFSAEGTWTVSSVYVLHMRQQWHETEQEKTPVA